MMRRSLLRSCTAAWPRGDARPQKADLFATGSLTHGFECTGVTHVSELGFTVFDFTHQTSGAQFHHIDSNDTNNAFCIGFGTPATSDRGTTHVLEHTALCGSERYPVRDPFFHMLRRSLASFMNAMTGADYTLYPFATTNRADFSNLLGVYLDAVFKPLLRADDFRQEGHRVEPASGDGGADRPVAHNGVVFNEMRGVMTEPPRHFMQTVLASSLPDTHYRHLSGGDPRHVLELTREELVEYHAKHYHPTNSVSLTYGDLDPRPHMAALDQYFGAVPRGERVAIPRLLEWRTEPQSVTAVGPEPAMGDPERQRRVLVTYGVREEDPTAPLPLQRMVRLNMLDTLLTDGPASPMYKALVADGAFGSSFAPLTGFAYYLSTPLLGFGVEGASNDLAPEEVKTAVEATLAEAAECGFSKRRIDAAVFSEELSQRHRGANYGVNACVGLAALATTIGARPADYINWLPHLQGIAAEPEVLQEEIQRAMGETHRTSITVTADKEYLETLRSDLEAKEAAANEAFRADAQAVSTLKADHKEWLARMGEKQESSCLPSLKVSDIPAEGFKEPRRFAFAAGVDVIHSSCNRLVYVHGLIPHDRNSLFDPSAAGARFGMPDGTTHDEQLLRLPLMHSLLTRFGTATRDYRDFDEAMRLCCSGFGIRNHVGATNRSPERFVCGTNFGFYTTETKLNDALALLRDLITAPRNISIDALERRRMISTIESRASASAEALAQRGHVIAMAAAAAPLSSATRADDLFGGLKQTEYLNGLRGRLSTDEDAVVANVTSWRDGFLHDLQRRTEEHGISLWAACDADASDAAGAALRRFREEVRGTASEPEPSRLHKAPLGTQTPRIAEISLPIDTHFVGMSIPTGLGRHDPEHAAVRVACQILQNEHLHREVRERGGAYGAFATASISGNSAGIGMGSYRDPSPVGTHGVFKTAGSWLTLETVTERSVEEAKLRLFASIDSPISAESFGSAWHLCRSTYEEQQEIRETLLGVTPQAVRDVAAKFNAENASIVTLQPNT